MPEPTDDAEFDLLIVGGGAGGVLTAIHALRSAACGTRIVLVEPAAVLAQGVAYATVHPEHLLNVPAQRMSGVAATPDDFVDYLVETGGEESRESLSTSYAQRRHYGQYLRQRLGEARDASAATLRVEHDRVVALEPSENSLCARLESGAQLRSRCAAIAVGNSSRPLPARGGSALPAPARLEAWDFDAIKRIDADETVCIAGSGLSMVDTVLSLARNGHRGRIHVLSRHALLPLPHTDHVACDYDPAPLRGMGLRQRMRHLRAAVKSAAAHGVPWQAVMERARPQVQALWCSLSHDDQRRFLRHVVRYWDVHRHRIAPQVYAQLQALQESGQMQLHRGRLDTVTLENGRIRVNMQMRDRRVQQLDVDRVVNATGVEMRAQLMRNPLLSQLLGSGCARPGPHGIGLDTGDHGELIDIDGAPQPRVVVVGSLRIGSLWESIAVPELRAQAEAAARRLLGT